MSWIQIRFYTEPAQQEKLEDAMLAVGALSITYEDAADQPILEPAINETPLWDQLIITALFTADIDTQSTLSQAQNLLSTELPKHKVEILEDKDWVREWMNQYHPMKFGENLWICPSWCEPPDPEAVNILLDPGLAFGTGTHPTTAMCLVALSAMDLKGKTVVDYGCGSGILAIAALLLGASSAVCVDIDPQALQATEENAKRNQIPENRIATYLPGNEPDNRADIVIANILAGPLMELCDTLTQLSHDTSEILLSGLIREQEAAMTGKYENFDFSSTTQDEWLCLEGKYRKNDKNT